MAKTSRRELVDVDAVKVSAFGLQEDLTPFQSDWHEHRKHQLLYSASGAMRLEVEGRAQGEGRQWMLPPQRAAWVRAGTPHRVSAQGEVKLRTLYVSPAVFGSNIPADSCLVFSVTPLAREMMLYAMRFGVDSTSNAALRRSYFETLCALCVEWVSQPDPLWLPVGHTPELKKAMGFTLANLERKITFSQVARAAATSERSLHRRFADEAKMSWRHFLRQGRVLRAMELLAQPGARVTEVGLEVGFESASAFTHAFERVAGESPRAYRARPVGR